MAPPVDKEPEVYQSPTKSSGESACSPPTWMKLPSLANCRCRCSGMADRAILLGMWEPTRNSLLRSNSLTCSATASFLCGEKNEWRSVGGRGVCMYNRWLNPTSLSSRWIPLISKSNMKSSATRLGEKQYTSLVTVDTRGGDHHDRTWWWWNYLVSGSSWATRSGSSSSLFRLWQSSTLVFSLRQKRSRSKTTKAPQQQITHCSHDLDQILVNSEAERLHRIKALKVILRKCGFFQ